MMITASLMVAAATVCVGANDAAGQSIVNARAEFNRAIAERDIGAVNETPLVPDLEKLEGRAAELMTAEANGVSAAT